MASKVSSAKGVRTRFRNILEIEMDNGSALLQQPWFGPDGSYNDELGLKISKCSEKLKLYVEKLEIQSEKLVNLMEGGDEKEVDDVVNADCVLCSIAMDMSLDLKGIREKMANEEKEKKPVGQFEDPNTKEVVQLQKQMQELLAAQLDIQKQNNGTPKSESASSVRLPKIDMPSYSGDKTKWFEFWDSFRCSVHDNKKISDVEKFNYLRSKLRGEAEKAISGLSLTNENYKLAVEILERRFGNIQEIIDLHYNKLMNLQPVVNTSDSLREFLDNVDRHLRSLEVLKQNISQDVFVSIIRSKLPENVLLQLEIQNGVDRKWTVKTLSDELRKYVVARERSIKPNKSVSDKTVNQGTKKPTSSQNKPQSKPSSSVQALAAGHSSQKGKQGARTTERKCRYCSQTHWSDECERYKTIDERKQRIKGSCYKCLKPGHAFKECKTKKACVYCGEMNVHHRSLCPKKFSVRSTMSQVVNEVNVPVSDDNSEESGLMSINEMVLMQTALTTVSCPTSGKSDSVRIFLDSGSQRSYITESMAKALSLRCEGSESINLVTFGSRKPKTITTKFAKVDISLKNGNKEQITVNVVPVISGELYRKPVKEVTSGHIKEVLNSVDLADVVPTTRETSKIDILIGNDYYLDFIHGEKIELKAGLYLLASSLGWILSGRTKDVDEQTDDSSIVMLSHGSCITRSGSIVSGADLSLPVKSDIEDFWNVESIGIVDDCDKSGDTIAMDTFRERLKFEDNRYQVVWPWKEENPVLPSNKELALCRLKSTVKRLKKSPEMLNKYNSVISDQLEKGVVEKVTQSEPDGLVHYIPHHAVITPQKTTTKLRVVYDASAKTRKENLSLNECLYRGPIMLNDLCGLLMRFRLHRVAVCADIEKAFLQLGLQVDQRDVTRFFWLKNINNPSTDYNNIQEYRFTRVPFGVISSPFLLGATIETHLENQKSELADKLKDDIYVDNLISGANTEDEAKSLYTSAKDIFNKGAMNLREWMSNSKAVLNSFADSDKSDVKSCSILGHCWDLKNDTFSIKPTSMTLTDTVMTKRQVLKRIASVFDPLGLLCPVVLKGKVFIQKLWSKGLDWDDSLCDNDVQTWLEIANNLEKIPECKITRCISKLENVEYRLVCFCDASGSAYATAIYLHQTSSEQAIANLVFAKTRLAPVKTLSIPRLELLAVVIGVRCLEFVKKQLKLEIASTRVWTDSQCTIHWINSENRLPVFVRNRVENIKKYQFDSVSYVPSGENPADIASRGCTGEKLNNSNLWWNGPPWLSLPEEQWPAFESTANVKETHDVSEVTSGVSLPVTERHDTHVDSNSSPFSIEIERFSTLTKLLRVTALAKRFIKLLRKETTERGHITSNELKDAETMWIKHVQKKNFPDLFGNKDTKTKPCIKRQLGVYVDVDGLLHCKGRLENAELCESTRFPVLLPKGDKYTKLVIEKCHKELLHSGVSHTLSTVRHRFWVPHGRASVKSVIKSCMVCRRHEGGPYKLPPMCSYPKTRVTEARPFARVGLDYLGPLFVKDNQEQKKVWICIFTCMVTRAIHLELVCDMSTSEFILCFRRFISQRGTPSYMISDNAKQFKTASTVLEKVWNNIHKSEDVWSYVSDAGITWTFNVELSPWLGGFYERLIGLVKRSMKKTIGRRLLTLIQLQTLLKEVESVVNTRPLVYVGDDVNSGIPLTPAHFLSLNPRTGIPELDIHDDRDYLPYESTSETVISLWKKGQNLLDLFWKAWREDYLISLRERTQRLIKSGRIHSKMEPKVNEIVLVKDSCSRGQWKFGKITKLTGSRDGLIRSVTVLLPSGKEIRRPLDLLYPLEVSQQSEHSQFRETSPVTTVTRTKRQAAVKAIKRIKDTPNL